MIEVTSLSKKYGSVKALNEVSFSVKEGEIVGLLGPNGAGKTTLMKIMAGYLQADSGQVTVDGINVITDTLGVQQRVGYLPENAPLYPELSVQAQLQLISDLRGVDRELKQDYFSRAVRATGLEDQLVKPISQLSKGYRQRVGLAQSILHMPKILILDEPTVGLDPTQIIEVRKLIGNLAENSTVFLSTHILSEVEAICDRAIVLLNGNVRSDVQISELSSSTVILVLEKDSDAIQGYIRNIDSVESVDSKQIDDGFEYRIVNSDLTDIRTTIFDLARDQGWPVKELRRESLTLESVFNDLVGSNTAVTIQDDEFKESEK
tara:strand:- start:24372 stop:25331 length:960 start_codon:yes stop_codon:yes gene_type:complete